MDRVDARRSLLVFAAILLPLTGAGYWFWLARNQHLPLMIAPAAAAVLTRVVRRERWSDLALRLRARRPLVLAMATPLAVCIVAYGLVWTLGLLRFVPARLPAPFPNLDNPLLHFAWTIFLSLSVVTAFFLPLAAGEEIGWRGHMLPRMIVAGVPNAALVSAVIWGAWHVPLILGAAYAPGGGAPVPAAAVFLVSAAAYGYFLAQLRLASGGLAAPLLAHAAWNALTQACFNPAVKPAVWPWLGESGLLVAPALVVGVAIAVRLLGPAKPLAPAATPA